jgi:ADP-heptose:LPS heptosyltransferase
MGSVPGLIRNDISDFDKTVRGYLQADEARVKSIRSELGVEGKKVIGISWKSFSPQNKSRKSIELSDFRNMFMDMDIVLVNLQYGDVDQEIREFKEETGIEVLQCSSIDNKEDIDGLAALIEVCDLVVSTSNVTIHLAGALGKETWVLLPFVSNYWWLLDRKDSIWYPSLSLYRQVQLNDWNEVFRSVQRDLKARFVSQGS